MIEATQPRVEPMEPADLSAVVRIAAASFDQPWSEAVFREELARPWARLWVLRCEGIVAAFVVFWWVRDEVHVLNLATHPSCRRRGLAGQLLFELAAFSERRAVRYVSLEVMKDNEPAVGLYRRFGFREIGSRPSYYADGSDALVMLKTL